MTNLQVAFSYVRQTFFPRWDRRGEWSIVFGQPPDRVGYTGYCDIQNKVIYIQSSFADRDCRHDELLLILIHEICHAVASPYHGEVWRRRYQVAGEDAQIGGLGSLASMIRREIKMYSDSSVPNVGLPTVVYGLVEDAVIDCPTVSYDTVLTWVRTQTGRTTEELDRRCPRLRKVYDSARRR